MFRSLEAFSFTYHVTISCCHFWRGGYFFTVNVPTFQCYLQWNAFLKYMYVYFQDLFDLSKLKIDILLGEIRSSDEEKIKHVLVSVCRGLFYCPQAPMKGFGTPFSNWHNRTVTVIVYKNDHLWKSALTNLGFWQWDRMNAINFWLHVNQSSTWLRY